jgi:Exopolyphosphatase
MVAAIARYHRRSLPKKRHEAWQALQSRANRTTVSEMALLLRLAAALDRRPEPVVASIQAEVSGHELQLGLIPERVNQNISLEQWSLESCAPVLREITGLNLTVMVQQ